MKMGFDFNTFEEAVERYGNPILHFEINYFDYDPEDIMMFSIPKECCVFKLPERPDAYITCCYFFGGWKLNTGERWIIKHLIEQCLNSPV